MSGSGATLPDGGRPFPGLLPVSWLVKDYVDYLLAGGEALAAPENDEPTSNELAALTERGGSFDWLADEPDLYSDEDGEPV